MLFRSLGDDIVPDQVGVGIVGVLAILIEGASYILAYDLPTIGTLANDRSQLRELLIAVTS